MKYSLVELFEPFWNYCRWHKFSKFNNNLIFDILINLCTQACLVMFGFGGGEKNNSFLGSESSSSESSSIIPSFQDESACAQICPNLTYKQR